MKKLAIFSLIAFLFAFAFILANTTEAQGKSPFEDKPIDVKYTAPKSTKPWSWKICDNCAKYHNNCVKCRKDLTNQNKILAKTCRFCHELERCPICDHKLIYKNFSRHDDKWPAYLCIDCAKYHKNGTHCVSCGKKLEYKDFSKSEPVGYNKKNNYGLCGSKAMTFKIK